MAKSTNSTAPIKKAVTVDNTVKETEKKIDTTVVEKENAELKEKLFAMETQMETLMKMMGSNMGGNSSPKKDIKDILVISLVTGHLLLTTDGLGSGRHYDFDEQFETVLIPENDLREIVRSMPKTTQNGYFYIDNKEFVQDMNLEYAYRKILSGEDLNKIFNNNCETFMKIYNSAVEGQKKIIVETAINKKMQKEHIDANILIELGKACDKDLLSIEPVSFD